METSVAPFALFQQWCHHAASLYGANWTEIQKYVLAQYSALPEADRRDLSQQMTSLFAERPEGLTN